MTTTDEELLNRGLPKWPQMIVTGPRLPEDLALEVIRRTDALFVSGHGCNDRDGDRRLAQRFRMPHFQDFSQRPVGFNWNEHWRRGERWKKAWGAIETQYVYNRWIGSSFVHGPHGWCHPDGLIYHIDNVGKWPSVEEIRDDWQMLASAFPFLVLTVTLMSGESVDDDTRPVVAMGVADGHVRLMEPNLGDHGPPRREFNGGSAAALFMVPSAQRERYPFSEDVMRAWEKKALEVDEEIAREPTDRETPETVPVEVAGFLVSYVEVSPPFSFDKGDIKFRAVTAEDTCVTWESFLVSCRDGMFTDDDGFGELATEQHVSNVRVDPLDALDPLYVRPSWATHVCWYNK